MIAVFLMAVLNVSQADVVEISPKLNIDFADPSVPDLSENGVLRIFMTAGEVLTWERDHSQSLTKNLTQKTPLYENLPICHNDGSPLNLDAGEDAWDPTLRDGVLYAGVMTPSTGEKYARWPDDNWSRRTYPFLFDGRCWIMQKRPLWGNKPKEVSWIGHNYGHQFIEDDDGQLYVFYERVSDDSHGQPWKTELFARRMKTKLRADDEEILILKIPQRPWPSTFRNSGGTLVEGARPFKAAGKYLISFSAGEYASDDYGIHLLWSDHIEGPYEPYLNSSGKDLKDFGKSLEKSLPLTWGAARAVFFQDGEEWFTLFHGIKKVEGQDLSEGKRSIYLAPVSITPRKSGPPLITIDES